MKFREVITKDGGHWIECKKHWWNKWEETLAEELEFIKVRKWRMFRVIFFSLGLFANIKSRYDRMSTAELILMIVGWIIIILVIGLIGLIGISCLGKFYGFLITIL